MRVRFVRPEDCPALLAIYAQYIHTDITFEYELPSREEFSRRIASFSGFYPYLVLEEEGRPVGYAYAHRIWERAAYQWDAELSVYLSRDAAGKGLGKRLCTVVLELLRLQGIRTVYSLVTSPNPASEKLHDSLGFRRIGAHEKTGYKNGHWIDVIWFEKHLNSFEGQPQPLRALNELPTEQVEAALAEF